MMKKEEKEQSKGSVGQIIAFFLFSDWKPDAGHGKRKTPKEKIVGCWNRRAVSDGTSADEDRDVSLCTL